MIKKNIFSYIVANVIHFQKSGLMPHLILPHGSYLMNLGNPDPEKLAKSRDMFIDELSRCDKLGIHHFNFHPGNI